MCGTHPSRSCASTSLRVRSSAPWPWQKTVASLLAQRAGTWGSGVWYSLRFLRPRIHPAAFPFWLNPCSPFVPPTSAIYTVSERNEVAQHMAAHGEGALWGLAAGIALVRLGNRPLPSVIDTKTDPSLTACSVHVTHCRAMCHRPHSLQPARTRLCACGLPATTHCWPRLPFPHRRGELR